MCRGACSPVAPARCTHASTLELTWRPTWSESLRAEKELSFYNNLIDFQEDNFKILELNCAPLEHYQAEISERTRARARARIAGQLTWRESFYDCRSAISFVCRHCCRCWPGARAHRRRLSWVTSIKPARPPISRPGDYYLARWLLLGQLSSERRGRTLYSKASKAP